MVVADNDEDGGGGGVIDLPESMDDDKSELFRNPDELLQLLFLLNESDAAAMSGGELLA